MIDIVPENVRLTEVSEPFPAGQAAISVARLHGRRHASSHWPSAGFRPRQLSNIVQVIWGAPGTMIFLTPMSPQPTMA
ncbi:hypothetical protein K466DRAFT_587955 [Polyporus arcularius HHB13444]|uniref:Uncharacterized protein n=1 Tax=Polyporus arcularius HHB13444 TaxID=1314778 RepID=A0A5C3P7Y3_9APHY|nr:hypothetical protein K466DRAFT_587955 [Polyporus arcularius HHB13444]